MKIATLSNAAAVHTQRWVDWFRRRGHDVRLWSLEQGPSSLGAESLPRLPLPGAARYPLAAPALRRALARFDPDVVDAHYVPNYGVLAVLSGRRPLSVAPWGSDLLLTAARDPLQRTRARFVLRAADLVVVDSENLAAAARAHGAFTDRVHVVPWGVDLEETHSHNAREPGLLLSARMLEPVYDVATVIEGASTILRRHPQTRLVIAGDGSLRARLEQYAKQVLPAGRFQFVGRLEHGTLMAWLARADLYLSASRSDSTSVSLLEAMAAGAIPVVSDIDGNREWVAEGRGARTFRPGVASELASAVERAWADVAWAEKTRFQNRRVIESRADRNVNMTRIESLFRELAARRRPVPR